MNLLIPHGLATDRYLTQAARDLGHVVHFICNLHEPERLDEIRQECNPDVWVPIASRFDLQMSNEDYQNWYHDYILSYVQDNMIHAILPCSSMDIVLEEVCKVNETLDLPGMRPEHGDFFRDKSVYIPALAKAGVRVPKTYEIVESGDEVSSNTDYAFPVIAKPGLGSGGYGIFIANDAEKLRWFFEPSDNPKGFSERALFYQDRDFAGKPKSYLHFGMGGRYLVQEYIEGPCISLAGTARGGVPKLDLAYDIGITPPPTCAEINFGWPSKHDIAGAAARLVSDLARACPIPFPDGAWMADTILHDGELWLVDLSCRMSSSGTKMLYHTCGNLSYASSVIDAVLHGEENPPITPQISTFYSFIPFPKGKLSNVKYPDLVQHGNTWLTEKYLPIQGEGRVFEMRNDIQVGDRGWIVAESLEEVEGNREDAEALVKTFIQGIQYDLE